LSRDELIKDYARFLAEGFFGEKRSILFGLHTGSLCFDAMSVIFAVFRCVLIEMNSDQREDIEFKEGDIVVYKGQRYKWRGIEEKDFGDREPKKYILLHQDARGKNGTSTNYVPLGMRNLIKPYYGTSKRTDGIGLRKRRSNREAFLAFLYGIPQNEVPTVINQSVVVVCDRAYFSELMTNICFKYDGKEVRMSDIAPASYFTSSRNEYQIGSNELKVDPVLKAVSDFSTARSLLLDKN